MWQLTLFADREQSEVAATWRFARMKDAAAVLQVKPSRLSNTYHQLIRPRGVLEYCTIAKCAERRPTAGRALTARRGQKCRRLYR